MVYQYIVSEFQDPHYNLALEEYIVRNIDLIDKKILFIYTNSPSIVLGKNQNILKEVNLRAFFETNHTITRRVSGGGTVVHDLGNINFSFFESHSLKKVNNYESSTSIIAHILSELGLECNVNDRNAIVLNKSNRKVSGSAQFSSNKNILSHLTLLYNSDLNTINKLLSPNNFDIETKASDSVRSKIDNVGNYLELGATQFINHVLQFAGYMDPFDLSELKKEVLENLIIKYRGRDYTYYKSCTGIIKKGNTQIKLKMGTIIELIGIDQPEQYLGKKILLDSDLEPSSQLWQKLLN